MDAGPERIAELGGVVRCPWRGAIGAGVAEVCASDPWTLDTPGMELALDVATLASWKRAALAAMRVLNDARRRDDAAAACRPRAAQLR